jgi:hypothetical protein
MVLTFEARCFNKLKLEAMSSLELGSLTTLAATSSREVKTE